MRFFSVLLIIILFGCTKQKTQAIKTDELNEKLKKEATQIAISYAKSILINPTTSIPDSKGVFSLSDSTKRIEFDPNSVHSGLIDDDQNADAIISLIFYHSNQTVTDHHLIMINKNGDLQKVADLELNIRVIVINNGKITAELHTKPRTSIYYNCIKCKKIVDYKFSNDSLIALY